MTRGNFEVHGRYSLRNERARGEAQSDLAALGEANGFDVAGIALSVNNLFAQKK
jgi:hypothetical protein